jgi:hypothetical protein
MKLSGTGKRSDRLLIGKKIELIQAVQPSVLKSSRTSIGRASIRGTFILLRSSGSLALLKSIEEKKRS